jgi:hypothetical protein
LFTATQAQVAVNKGKLPQRRLVHRNLKLFCRNLDFFTAT